MCVCSRVLDVEDANCMISSCCDYGPVIRVGHKLHRENVLRVSRGYRRGPSKLGGRVFWEICVDVNVSVV